MGLIPTGEEKEQCNLYGVSSSNLKNTLDNLCDILEKFNEIKAEVPNGIYNPVEEFTQNVLNNYIIVKR